MSKNKHLPLIVIFLVCLLIVSIWFKNGLMFAGGEDVISFYNPNSVFDLFLYSWNPQDTGTPQATLFARVPYFYLIKILYNWGISGLLLQAMTFFLLMSAGTLAIYFLLKETLSKDLPENMQITVPLIGALFYLLNPYSMSQIWDRGLYNQFFSFALIPIFLLFFIVGLNRKKIIYGLLAIVSSFIFSTASTHPATIITTWANPIIYLIFYFFNSRNNVKNIYFGLFYIITILISWFLVNAFWIYPFIKIGKEVLNSSFNTALTNNIDILKGVSSDAPITSVLRLLHNGIFFNGLYYGEVYLSFSFILISWLIPLIAFFSFPFFKKMKNFKFYFVLFLIGLFISSGANSPLGWLIIFIFQSIPFLQVFRNPYEKYGINFLIAYLPFFAIGFAIVSIWFRKKLKSARAAKMIQYLLIVLIFGIFLWPMWTGKFAVKPYINPWVKVPNYYKLADDWLMEQKGDFQLLQLPLTAGDGIRYTWDFPFQGIEPSHYFFQKASIRTGYSFTNSYYAPIGEEFVNLGGSEKVKYTTNVKKVLEGDKIIEGLALLNVRYIILHNDVDYKFSHSPSIDQNREYLKKQENIKFVKKFGELEIYEVEQSKNLSLIYSPDTEIEVSKKNQTFYNIYVKNAKGEINLYFLQNFNPGWELLLGNQLVTEHEKVFSYANSWKINKSGNYTLTLSFKPQQFVYSGFKISLISLIIVSIVIIIIPIWKKVRNL
ncbi:MAG: alpha-(1-_3)-arabinofuranosyltransferase family protein [Candidatus Daviesbacteria bacterium]|nr:alpha-(1->3)-arabinofuranosyltransferase family protein [Candidatus Daviesbacteria bacterium]